VGLEGPELVASLRVEIWLAIPLWGLRARMELGSSSWVLVACRRRKLLIYHLLQGLLEVLLLTKHLRRRLHLLWRELLGLLVEDCVPVLLNSFFR